MSNRALVCAALTAGESRITGLASGDDTTRMIEGLRTLGASLTTVDGDAGGETRVAGPIAFSDTAPLVVDAGLAGTTSRFLTAIASLRKGPTLLTGEAGLRSRPMAELHRILREIGANVVGDREGFLPVTVHSGSLRVGEVTQSADAPEVVIQGDVSSQFISAVMLIAPCLGGLRIRLNGPVVSSGYLEMTADIMREFGASVSMHPDRIEVDGSPYRATTLTVDADWSSASYPFAAVAIAGGEVRVPHLRCNGSQPEEAFLGVLARMGCESSVDVDGVVVRRRFDTAPTGIDVDMSAMSDLVPTVAAIAACAKSPTRIRGVGFIRAKESDRLGDLGHELAACGAVVSVHDDGLTIEPKGLRSATLQSHDDHRLAMSLSLLGLRQTGIEIADAHVVSKSWPEFWSAIRHGFALLP